MTNSPASGPERTGISVLTNFRAMNPLLYFSKPRIGIDGDPPEKVRWGDNFIPTAAGTHTVRCFVPYIHLRHMGDSEIEVRVPAGRTVALRWQSPLGSLYLKGKWTVVNSGSG
jgi:hypothetical protein